MEEKSFEHQGIVYNTSKNQMARDNGINSRTFSSRLNRGLSMGGGTKHKRQTNREY
jgi:hypothetical protein